MSGALTRRQGQALEVLLVAPTVNAAARASGISTRSLWRFLAIPAFNAELRRRRGQAIGQAASMLMSASGAAVSRLLVLADDPDPEVRFPAVRVLLDFAFRAAEVGDLYDRIADLERRLAERQAVGGSLRLRAVPRHGLLA